MQLLISPCQANARTTPCFGILWYISVSFESLRLTENTSLSIQLAKEISSVMATAAQNARTKTFFSMIWSCTCALPFGHVFDDKIDTVMFACDESFVKLFKFYNIPSVYFFFIFVVSSKTFSSGPSRNRWNAWT